MPNSTHTYQFRCEITTVTGKLAFLNYSIKRNGYKKSLHVDPPPIFRNVIFDIMQEYEYYGGKLNIEHTISYVHLDSKKSCDLVCLDVASLEPEHKIDKKRAITPAKYHLYYGNKVGRNQYFYGDIYNSIINATWDNNEDIELITRKDSDEFWCKYSGIINLKFSVRRRHSVFIFEGHFSIRRHLLGEMIGIALIPKFPDKDTIPKHAIVAAQWHQKDGNMALELSNTAWQNLKNLGQLLEYRGAQTVWVYGEPGSGKEVFAQALHAGSVVSRRNSIKIRSVAGVKLEEFNQRLFSSRFNELCLIEQVDGGGSIFLDEFDKIEQNNIKPVCSTLLRVLEADEYIKVAIDSSGQKREALAKIDKINWIFAGAFSTTDSQQFPLDFWSRLTGTLKITNSIKKSKKYAANLFLYFYLSEVIKGLGSRHEVNIDKFVSVLETEPDDRRFNERITACVIGIENEKYEINKRLLPSASLLRFAKIFADNVIITPKRGEKVDSSRGIRQAAKAAFFAMRQWAIENGEDFDFKKASTNALGAAKEMLKTSRGSFVKDFKA